MYQKIEVTGTNAVRSIYIHHNALQDGDIDYTSNSRQNVLLSTDEL